YALRGRSPSCVALVPGCIPLPRERGREHRPSGIRSRTQKTTIAPVTYGQPTTDHPSQVPLLISALRVTSPHCTSALNVEVRVHSKPHTLTVKPST
ncbi:hypothetical protein P171DRAFT_378988, partial [Karstenula rhodostoma CBS 690.94]